MQDEYLADTIVRLFEPVNVLHIGCKDTKLIEALEDRDVSAFGLTSFPIDFERIKETIANKVFVMDDMFIGDVYLPVYDLIVADNYIENLPVEDLAIIRMFLDLHADRHYFRVLTHRNGGSHRLEWWQDWYKNAYWEEFKPAHHI